MVETTYFAKLRGNKELQKKAVSISLLPPKGWNGKTYKKLYPSKELLKWWKGCKQTPEDAGKYEVRYDKEVLSKLDVHSVAKKLNGYVLVCYEKPSDFCHRHLVAKWLRDNGYEAREHM